MVKGPGRPATKQKYGNDGSGIAANKATRWETGYGQSNRNRGFAGGSPVEGPSWPKYCIFCEQNTHNTTHCTIKKYTAQYKENKCKKQNACFMCFRTTEHKAQTWPKFVKCFLCPRVHHFNNHSRAEIDEYFKRNPNRSGRKKWLLNSETHDNHPNIEHHNSIMHEHMFYHQHELYPSTEDSTQENHHQELDKFITPSWKPFLFGVKARIGEQEINILLDPGSTITIMSKNSRLS